MDPIYEKLRKTPVQLEEEPYDFRRHSTVQVALRTLILSLLREASLYHKRGGCEFHPRHLSQRSSPFWKSMGNGNRSQRLEIKEVTKEAALQNGASDVHEKGQYACYNHLSHCIEVDTDSPPAQTVDLLFFETMNALQRVYFKKYSI